MWNWTADLRIPRSEPQRLHGERGLLRSSYDTRPAYCYKLYSSIFSELCVHHLTRLESFYTKSHYRVTCIKKSSLLEERGKNELSNSSYFLTYLYTRWHRALLAILVKLYFFKPVVLRHIKATWRSSWFTSFSLCCFKRCSLCGPFMG